jgi:hypothetical protein
MHRTDPRIKIKKSFPIDFYKNGRHGRGLKIVVLRCDRVRPGKKIVGGDLEYEGLAAHRGLGSAVDEALQPRDCIVEIGVLHPPEASAQQTLMATPLGSPYVVCSEAGATHPVLSKAICRAVVNGG